MLNNLCKAIRKNKQNVVAGLPAGTEAALVAALRKAMPEAEIVVILNNAKRARHFREMSRFFDPLTHVDEIPAWDCLPYDRVSPNAAIIGRRVAVLGELGLRVMNRHAGARTIVTTLNAAMQKLPPPEFWAKARMNMRVGDEVDLTELARKLVECGYVRCSEVMDIGDFSVRGDIVDIYTPGYDRPVRIDFFGEEIDSIRAFDPLTQRSSGEMETLVINSASEMLFDPESIERFDSNWNTLFGTDRNNDELYVSALEGVRHSGIEHMIGLFHDELVTIFDYFGDNSIFVLDTDISVALEARIEAIHELYTDRKSPFLISLDESDSGSPVVPPAQLYLDVEHWTGKLEQVTTVALSSLETVSDTHVLQADARYAREFSAERSHSEVNLFESVCEHIKAEIAKRQRLVIACLNASSQERLDRILHHYGVSQTVLTEPGDWANQDRNTVVLEVFGIEHGFVLEDLTVLTEQDIFGERVRARSNRRTKSDTERLIMEASQLAEGDIVVHVEHGIGRFTGLETLTIDDAPHDCIRLVYANGDKLFVPVENIDSLSRYGSGDTPAQLDRLGSSGWQERHARLRSHVLDMAGDLLKTASERMIQHAPVMVADEDMYSQFCTGFRFEETEDQLKAIEDVREDLASGHVMDRLVCGDVGYGKTEVAMRAAQIAVTCGFQVAIIAPTTLLTRQHYNTFSERFASQPVIIGTLSRLVSRKDVQRTKTALAEGKVDIVIGTHALLAKDIEFANLGLLVIDEEQRFGVRQKERLKQLRSTVHAMTLTATPIPRTLQMAFNGVKDLSLIATAPFDRLAIRTSVGPFDPIVVREAIRRERQRNGQIYVICPQISDLQRVKRNLAELVPDLKISIAHGRLPSAELEDVMEEFYAGKVDALVSTTIIESGLDIPNVNTMIVFRSDRFGLAQLYQLRGRVGRSNNRAYAYLTVPRGMKLGDKAQKRLRVFSRLDALGAGFSLASQDLDLRGAGNLLGAEQTGHIQEVGIELYQRMLLEAVEKLQADQEGRKAREAVSWSPEVSIGSAILIPGDYVSEMDVRLALYRRIAALEGPEEIREMRWELADRFGELPDELENLFDVVAIKVDCRRAGIARVDAGPGGALISFRNNVFPNAGALLHWIQKQKGAARLRSDQKVVVTRKWDDVALRLEETGSIVSAIADLAESRQSAPPLAAAS